MIIKRRALHRHWSKLDQLGVDDHVNNPPCIKRTNPKSEPDPDPESWLLYLAIGALRLAGRIDVTEATRWAGRSMDRPSTILGLTS